MLYLWMPESLSQRSDVGRGVPRDHGSVLRIALAIGTPSGGPLPHPILVLVGNCTSTDTGFWGLVYSYYSTPSGPS